MGGVVDLGKTAEDILDIPEDEIEIE